MRPTNKEAVKHNIYPSTGKMCRYTTTTLLGLTDEERQGARGFTVYEPCSGDFRLGISAAHAGATEVTGTEYFGNMPAYALQKARTFGPRQTKFKVYKHDFVGRGTIQVISKFYRVVIINPPF